MTARWIALALVGLAAAATMLLPVEPAVTVPPAPVQALFDELRDVDRRIRTRAWIDSVAPRVVAEAPSLDHPVVVVPSSIAVDDVDEMRRALVETLADGPRDDAIALGRFVALLDAPGDPLARTARYWWRDHTAIMGRVDGRPYCLVVDAVESDEVGWAARRVGVEAQRPLGRAPRVLGGCWLVARYGLPGPSIADWYDRTGADLGSRHPHDVTIWGELVRREMSRTPELPFFVLSGLAPRRTLPLDAQRCVTGDADVCAHLVTRVDQNEPLVIDHPWIDAVVPSSSSELRLPEVVDPAFLSRLESHFGPDGFRAFWTSELELEPAFEAAFGISLGRYVMNRAHETYGEVSPGPGVDVAGWWGLLFAIAIGVGSGALVSGRRRLA